MNIQNIDSMTFFTKKPQECFHFYHDLLHIPVTKDSVGMNLHCGKHTLVMCSDSSDLQLRSRNHGAAGSQNFCLRAVGDPEQILAYLTLNGVHLTEHRVERCDDGALGDIYSIYMLDPDGCLVEIAVYKPEKTAFSITALDHLVIIANDILETMDFYTGTLGIRGSLKSAPTKDDMHGFLLTDGQRFNVHHQKPLYKPHIPYAATGSVNIRMLSDASNEEIKHILDANHIAWMESVELNCGNAVSRQSIVFNDPNGNLIRMCGIQ